MVIGGIALIERLARRRRIFEPRGRRARSHVIVLEKRDRWVARRIRVAKVLVRVHEVYVEVGAGYHRRQVGVVRVGVRVARGAVVRALRDRV